MGCPPGFTGGLPVQFGYQPFVDFPPSRPQQALTPKPRSPVASTQLAAKKEPPPGYRYRVEVPPPGELGIVLPE